MWNWIIKSEILIRILFLFEYSEFRGVWLFCLFLDSKMFFSVRDSRLKSVVIVVRIVMDELVNMN